jgi:hypothetical protein
LGVVVWGNIADLTGFFRGGFGKKPVLVMVICGESVVRCVADVMVKQPYLELHKIRHRIWIFLLFLR